VNPTSRPPLSETTRAYVEASDPAHRKALGQYFTPADLRDALLDRLDLPPRPRILDPACGTGEFLRSAAERWPDARLEGWEIDPDLVPLASSLAPAARVRCRDALRAPWREAFDAVVGNPPYFEFRADAETRRRYRRAISGRPNVYALFVLLGLEVLRPGGGLAFVVSASMRNGAFFRALRRAILEEASVEWLHLVRDEKAFPDARQPVMLLVLRKGGRDGGRHVFRHGEHAVFAERPEDLERLFAGRTTLGELGYDVRTGTVVWNERREQLTDDPRDAVRLVWSRDIRDGRIDPPGTRPDRPSWVRGMPARRGPAIVVNRVTGTGARARLRVAVVPPGEAFVGENHVNVVFPPDPAPPLAEIERIAEELRSPVAAEAARRLTGNAQISGTELRELIPVTPGS
jgi:adenine-specific DNA-methyltransferase